MANEYEKEINEWMEAFEELPEDRKDSLYRWFATQKIIIENSGLSQAEWFGYIQWAMDNPLDYSFVQNFPDEPEATVSGDGAEKKDTTRDARAFVGGDTSKKPLADGPGLKDKAKAEGLEKELFNRFMHNRLGGGSSDD